MTIDLQKVKVEMLGRFIEVLESFMRSKKNITNEIDTIEDIEELASNERVAREYIFIFNQIFGYSLEDIQKMIDLSQKRGKYNG